MLVHSFFWQCWNFYCGAFVFFCCFCRFSFSDSFLCFDAVSSCLPLCLFAFVPTFPPLVFYDGCHVETEVVILCANNCYTRPPRLAKNRGPDVQYCRLISASWSGCVVFREPLFKKHERYNAFSQSSDC